MSSILKISLIVVGVILGIWGIVLIVEIFQTAFFKFLWRCIINAVIIGAILYNLDDEIDIMENRTRIITYSAITLLFSIVFSIYEDFLFDKWWIPIIAFIILAILMATFCALGSKFDKRYSLIIGATLTAITCTIILIFASGKSLKEAVNDTMEELSKPTPEEDEDVNYWSDVAQY